MKQTFFYCIFLFLSLSCFTYAQEGETISGVVKDDQGQTVIGASVFLKGTSKGTVTDIDGKFSLTAAQGDVIKISYVGSVTQEVKVGSNRNLTIKLAQNSQNLEEVVVIGYGTMKRKDLVGSVSSLSGNALKDIPVTSAAEALVGKLAGVNISASEGGPDAQMNIKIRGGGSITGDNSPLYIVDGFPVQDINSVSTSDIESIDVLKDASSTAIYGARGANGVVIITTKKGTAGKSTVTFNSYVGMKSIKKFYDVFSPYEYALNTAEQFLNTGQDYVGYYGSLQDIGMYKSLKGNNWQKQLLGEQGYTFNNNVSVSGGDKMNQYNIGLMNTNDKDVFVNSGLNLTNFSAKLSTQVSPLLKVDMNVRLSDKTIKGAGPGSGGAASATGSSMSNMIQFAPIITMQDYLSGTVKSDPATMEEMMLTNRLLNPVLQVNDTYRNQNQFTLFANGAVTLSLSKKLTFRTDYGANYYNTELDQYSGKNTGLGLSNGRLPLASINTSKSFNYKLSNVFNFNHTFENTSKMSIVLGEELNSSSINTVYLDSRQFPSTMKAKDALSNMNLAGVTYPIETVTGTPINTSSWFGRTTYDYKGRYLFSASLRADGSSRFAPGKQWGYFPSLGLGWRVSDESFMQSSKDWLSNLKLRSSYGTSGNDKVPQNVWRPVYTVNTGDVFLGNDETTQTAYLKLPTAEFNPNLKWETTIARNVGVDFDFFNGRINGSIEGYWNTVKDLLLNAKVPQSTGYVTQYQNIGQTSNKGIELSLNGVFVNSGGFQLKGGFNCAFNKNNIDKLGYTTEFTARSNTAGFLDNYLIKEGQPLGQMYGFQVEGMYSFDDFTYNPKPASTTGLYNYYTLKPGVSSNATILGFATAQPGSMKLKDQNNDGIIDQNDRVVLGNANPVASGGFNLNASYVGFDLTAYFNFSVGNSVYNATKGNFTADSYQQKYRSFLNEMNSENRFVTIDPNNTGAGLLTNPVDLYNVNKNASIWSVYTILYPQTTSFSVEDASFLRLNTLTLGYTIPKKVAGMMKISNLRIYSTVSNLFVLTKYTGNDPEVSKDANILAPGVDWGAYPRTRSITVGFNLTM